jgi:hypothetical protein
MKIAKIPHYPKMLMIRKRVRGIGRDLFKIQVIEIKLVNLLMLAAA